MKYAFIKTTPSSLRLLTTDSNHTKPLYENVLNRDFTITAINQKWAGDITSIHTEEGWLYLAVIIDLYSRAVIDWSMDKRMKASLVCDALSMTLYRACFSISKGIIITNEGIH